LAVQTETAAAGRNWSACTPEDVVAAAGVDPGVGLSAAQAADLLARNGPNSLPEEKPRPGWRRFLGEYRSYMQIILVAAAVVSLLIKEWSTAVLLILLTVLNAVVGMRQEGNAPFGFALGFDRSSPGLMGRMPRPRGEAVLTTGVMITVGLAGLAITIGLLSMIEVGQHLFGSIQIGQSIAFTAFALCLIVAAVECRSETGTALTTATFDSKQMNWAMLGEFVLAVLVTQMDVFNRLLGTTQLNLRQFGWALIPALALLVLWELGKYVARRRKETT
jgi:magnesium-transporting ATPase (P-type)